MSRLRPLIRALDLSSPEATRQSLARVLGVIDEMFDALDDREWPEVTALQRGDVRAKFGQLVRVDTTGNTVPHVYLPEAKTTDIGKRIGVSRNYLSPTCLPVIHPAGDQKLRYAVTGLTLVPSVLDVREVFWTGSSWEGGY